jgi:elongation factor Ts
MTELTMEMIKELRERTGVGMSKCKEALVEANGDMEQAIHYLRKKGIASAVKKEGRETKEGKVVAEENGDTIVLLEANAETDFVTQNEKFIQFVHDLCQQALKTKPALLSTFLSETFEKDPSITIEEYRSLMMQALGENIQVKRLELIPKAANCSYGIYSHMAGKIITIVRIEGSGSAEHLAKDIAMHVAAEDPEYLAPEDVPAEIKAREEEIAKSQVVGKPANVVEKIVAGKIKAYCDQTCLLCQKFIKDTSLTVSAYVEQEGKKLGKPLKVKEFWRWQIGR